jgi:hypothetical protein
MWRGRDKILNKYLVGVNIIVCFISLQRLTLEVMFKLVIVPLPILSPSLNTINFTIGSIFMTLSNTCTLLFIRVKNQDLDTDRIHMSLSVEEARVAIVTFDFAVQVKHKHSN